MRMKEATLLVAGVALSGCVSNQSVQTVQAGDEDKSCEQLQADLVSLGAKFEDAKDDSGLTGKNVGLALVFWPGIIVNEVRSNKNQDSLDARVSYLSGIYNRKCLDGARAVSAADDVEAKLRRLDRLKSDGTISEEEYDAARRRALEQM